MPTTDSNAFELERRGFQWSANNTLDDGATSLLYDGDPNSVVDGNTAGESKLYSLLPGATYFQSTGTLWLKTSSPNVWGEVSIGSTTSGGTAGGGTSGGYQSSHSLVPNVDKNILSFSISAHRSSKCIITGFNSTNYYTVEVLVAYHYTSNAGSVAFTSYGSLGDTSLFSVTPVLSGNLVILTLATTGSNIHVDVHQTLVSYVTGV